MADETKDLDRQKIKKMSFKDKIKNMNLVQNYRKIFPYVRPYLGRAILALVITIPKDKKKKGYYPLSLREYSQPQYCWL